MAKKSPRKKKSKNKIVVLFSFLIAAFLFSAAYFDLPYLGQAIRQIAGPFFAEKITPEDIKKNYEENRVKILIVPGHDDHSFGTQYKNIKEADLNAALGSDLAEFFRNDKKFESFITREKTGGYQSWFWKYFEENKPAIRQFRSDSQKKMRDALKLGGVKENNIVYHNDASDEDSLKLYAINKWANDNNIDIVLHIHFNDYPGRNINRKGEYSGFSVYIPEKQLPNHRSSSELASALKSRLEKYFPKSDLPQEKEMDALIEDQELIAVGSNASRDGASVLIEYGYIYEPPLENAQTRPLLLKELAFQTYLGIKSFFGQTTALDGDQTTLLPHTWSSPLKKDAKASVDAMKLQRALHQEGLYPPDGKELSDCPINGVFGNCTKAAVMNFQQKYKYDILLPEKQTEPTGFVGPNTIKKLNELYGE
ncbi:MAG: N-acetylmuramoyl-L-alanine amidase [Candidatus Pacebacteria bacterium]|nr:N-acetylmuramoyl-L-alanine amidase [Candidatus Paceibacterota bacterium]